LSSALEALRLKNRADVTLPSGLAITIRLPRLRDCIVAGDVPLAVLERAEKADKTKATTKLSNTDIAALGRFQDELVRAAVVAIDGEPVTLERADVAEFSEEDYDEIRAYAMREKALPGKAE
jgi:hypothetical protein